MTQAASKAPTEAEDAGRLQKRNQNVTAEQTSLVTVSKDGHCNRCRAVNSERGIWILLHSDFASKANSPWCSVRLHKP